VILSPPSGCRYSGGAVAFRGVALKRFPVPKWCQTSKKNSALSRTTQLISHLENRDFAETLWS